MPMTVAEVAARICRPGADLAGASERIRHWTSERLLEPLGDRSPGTGNRRRYDDSVVYAAGILDALANLGLHVGKQRFFLVVLDLAGQAVKLWKKGGGEPGLFLEVADFGTPDPDGGRHAVFLHTQAKRGHHGRVIHPRAAAGLVLNVSALFHQIDERAAAAQAEVPPPLPLEPARMRKRARALQAESEAATAQKKRTAKKRA